MNLPLAIFDWETCDHTDIGKPGCRTCDTDESRIFNRYEYQIRKLQEELMLRDTRPDFERGELAGQDAMMRHIALLTEESNSQLAEAVRNCALVKARAEILRQAAENLESASYSLREPFDPEAAKAFHVELGIVQSRAAKYAGKKEEY